ncbi:MAG: AtpZ/AtpI family protein [Alphaproteobacteria bacterium]|nr:AtpZ/AtpI family protein [Alphaproteobacteria bacterium]MBU0798079.1 AtpZ/AtpI family protein [Alphaproteobacteria bacterium]MBU0888779.1 AtpZ/AtpI family protein [Alphaproteobacteria bacterium]MBU1812502.1 AtpZ/AtpI family protein [Alphaproteobacteria bacterium]MBU2090270.1 AtpZ/AtpI family protein [Alphaproteobacteria bacterium]
MTDRDPDNTSLRDLSGRLTKARRTQDGNAGQPRDKGLQSSLGMGFRIGVEMVSAVVVGLGIGWLLDYWLGTGPWLLVLFFFLGAGGGVMNVYRAVSGIGMGAGYKKPGQARSEDAKDGDV